MAATGWVSFGAVVILIVVLAIVLFDNRNLRQRRNNDDGRIAGLELDLDAARDRIAELQTYLSDYESWAANPTQPVPPHLADRATPDRWSRRTNDPSSPPIKRAETT